MSFVLTIFFGFLLIFVTTKAWAIVCLTLALVFFIPLLFAFRLLKPRCRNDIIRISESNPVRYNEQKMESLAFWVSVTMPLFGITYLLAAINILSPETSAGVFQLLSMAIKGFYGAILLDLQEEAAVMSRWMLQQEIAANNSRISYLKYVFHEVRNPLNSLVLGIDILEQSSSIQDKTERSTEYPSNSHEPNNFPT